MKIEIDGMTCSVGDVPKSGYTVGELRARLEGFNQSAKLGFSMGPDDNLEVLSIYEASDTGHVWVDLGEAEDESAAAERAHP